MKKKKYLFLATIILLQPIVGLAEELQNSEEIITVTEQQTIVQEANENSVEINERVGIPTTVHLSNFYGVFPTPYAVYGAEGELPLYIYTNEVSSILPVVYIILPEGVKLNGDITNLQQVVDDFLTSKPITGNVTASQLPNTSNDRQVFQLTPSPGSFVTANPNQRNELKVPIKVTTDQAIKGTSMNANNISLTSENVLFVGTNNVVFDNSVGMYPEVDTNAVGIQTDIDSKVRGIAYNGIKRTVGFINATVTDKYQLVDESGNSVAPDITKTGDSNTTYSRDGLINKVENWGFDPLVYDVDTLTIDDGNLNGMATWTAQAVFVKNPVLLVDGETHILKIKRFAKDVTVKYVDEDGKDLIDSIIISGHVNDPYESNAKELKGYTLKETPSNATGTFT
ncbi:MucBP domain-containing protein, partial [Enterococcus faecalis]